MASMQRTIRRGHVIGKTMSELQAMASVVFQITEAERKRPRKIVRVKHGEKRFNPTKIINRALGITA